MSSSPFNTDLIDAVSKFLKKQQETASIDPSISITSSKKHVRYIDLMPKKLGKEKDVVDSLDQWLETSLATVEKIEEEVAPPIMNSNGLSPRARSFLSKIEDIVEKTPAMQEHLSVENSLIMASKSPGNVDIEKTPWLQQAFAHLEKTRQEKYKRMIS